MQTVIMEKKTQVGDMKEEVTVTYSFEGQPDLTVIEMMPYLFNNAEASSDAR